ncbi:MAG: hypothetical protein ABI654_16350 [Betaproteobacteria bacterium]
MKIIRWIFTLATLAFLGAAWAGPIPDTQESRIGFLSFDLPSEQTGSFELSFDAAPLADKIDAFTGISAAAPSTANDVAAIVRFADTGVIDVRNGGVFRADQALKYAANQVYRIRMAIDVASRTYSVSVTPPGQPEILLARNYAFRSQQSGVKSLGKIVLAGFTGSSGSFAGSHRVTGVTLKAVP